MENKIKWSKSRPTESGWYLCFEGTYFTTSDLIYWDEIVTRWYSKKNRKWESLPENLSWFGPVPDPTKGNEDGP